MEQNKNNKSDLLLEKARIQERMTVVYWQKEWAKTQLSMAAANETILEMKLSKIDHQLSHIENKDKPD